MSSIPSATKTTNNTTISSPATSRVQSTLRPPVLAILKRVDKPILKPIPTPTLVSSTPSLSIPKPTKKMDYSMLPIILVGLGVTYLLVSSK